MGRTRVYELAKELNISNKDLVLKLQSLGYAVKSHSSTIEDYQVKEIKKRLQGKESVDVAEKKSRPTIIRRRKKAVPSEEVVDEALDAERDVSGQAESYDKPEAAAIEKLEVPEGETADEAAVKKTGEVGDGIDDKADSYDDEIKIVKIVSRTETPAKIVAPPPIAEEIVDPAEETYQADGAGVKAEEEKMQVEESVIKSEAEPEKDSTVVIQAEAVAEKTAAADVSAADKVDAAGMAEEPAPDKKVETEAVMPIDEEKVAGREQVEDKQAEEPVDGKRDRKFESRPEGAEPGERMDKAGKPKAKDKKAPETGKKIRPEARSEDVAKPRHKFKARPGMEAEPEPRAKIKIKRIEKTTSEPAKIISKPKFEEKKADPPRTRPELKPVDRKPVDRKPMDRKPIDRRPVDRKPKEEIGDRPPRKPFVKPKPVVEIQQPLPEKEGKKLRKKKKGKEFGDQTNDDFARKKTTRRREVIERDELYDTGGWDRPSRGRKGSKAVKKTKKTELTVPKAIKRRVKVDEAITVADLAKRMGIKSGDIIKNLMGIGVMANLNQSIDYDTAVLVAADFGFEVEKGAFDEDVVLHMDELNDRKAAGRPPVVTVMGHVDHGKTSLLDAIRKTNVTSGEAGGITQHIGAYHVEVPGGRVTFLDTPGHEAFTAMRARGAQVTDIVILIVAADDGVMQQTREAADHARAAGVPIIVAVNKIDKPGAEPDKIRREVSELGLVPEDWGGDTIFAEISAKQGTGIDELMDLILLQAEMLELQAPDEGRARGHVVEARLDKGRGPVATVLVQSGKLKQGDSYVCGVYSGKVRAMFDDKGRRVDEAGPSIPVEIQGISGVPQAGDEFISVEDEKQAKQVSEHRQLKLRERELRKTSRLTLENLFDSIKEGAVKELNLVLKADVQGSLEAIIDALQKLGNEEIKVNLIHSSTGAITESDIMLASASDALVVGFNVRPTGKVQELADKETIQIRFYDVIYKLIDEIKVAMAGMLAPIEKEIVLGQAEVRETFHVSKVGMIAGTSVTSGKVTRGANARLLREGVVIYDGKITSLKRFKDDAKEVVQGYECGIGLENYNDVKVGDVIEAYEIEEIAATLD